ncbi:RBL20, partial [Symbiodinium sp. KB8]
AAAGLAPPLTGPTLLLFALFPLYMRLVPRRVPAQFTLLGISFSDKAMVYLAGLQLAFADAVVGTVLGALYLANVAGVGAARWPAAVHSTAEAAFLPVLGEEHPSRVAARRAAARAQRERQQLQAQAMAMARQGGARGEQLRALQAMLAAQGGAGAEGGGGGVPMGGTGGGPTPPPPMPRVEPDEAAVQQLMAMGFDRTESEAALAATGNNADAAAARLLGD